MQTKKITVLGLCVALAMILSYIESILPVFVGIPGAKLGLPNMVIVLLLYLMGAKEAVCFPDFCLVICSAFYTVWQALWSAFLSCG